MRIIIGITQNPNIIKTLLTEYGGSRETLVEMGPFISEEEAENWLKFLTSHIGSIKQIAGDQAPDEEKLWYGFTFEQITD